MYRPNTNIQKNLFQLENVVTNFFITTLLDRAKECLQLYEAEFLNLFIISCLIGKKLFWVRLPVKNRSGWHLKMYSLNGEYLYSEKYDACFNRIILMNI